MRIAQEEIFGPTTALIPVGDLDEAIRVSNGIKYGLSSSIFTRDVNAAFRAMRDLEAGITYVNAGTIGAEVHLPFGGTKDTGNGHREAGQAALDVFTEWKSIYVDYSGQLQRAQIDTEAVVEYRAARRQRSPGLGDLPRHVDDVRRQPRRRRPRSPSSTPPSTHGVNFFDTANIYSEGRSEEVLGPRARRAAARLVRRRDEALRRDAGRRPRALARAGAEADRRLARPTAARSRRPLPVPLPGTTTSRSRRRSAR